MAEQVDAGRKLQIYEELATKDMLTKLYNRNAYDEWIKVNRRPKKAKIVVFDLNNLKQCNDTMGHAAGDAYIQNAAGIILHVFGNCGNCYRIGGDEFCVVIYGNDPSDMEELFRQMKQEQDEFNSKTQYHRYRLPMAMRSLTRKQTGISRIPDPVQMTKCIRRREK